MFQDRMVTPAIPERVYALCKIVEKGPLSNSELSEKMEPGFLGNSTSYYANYRNAAEELGLISLSDNMISLAVDPDKVKSIEAMRRHAISKLPEYKSGQFWQVTRAYFEMGDAVLRGEKNISNMAQLMAQATGCPVDSPALRAWRFWVSFLGFGYLQDMFIIPNADAFLRDAIALSGLEKGKSYSFGRFIEQLRPYADVVLDDDPNSRKLNYGVSNGLRTLNDMGVVKLEHILDQEDLWTLYPMKAHAISGTVTNITICR